MPPFGLEVAALSGLVAVLHRTDSPPGPCTAASCAPPRIVLPPSVWGCRAVARGRLGARMRCSGASAALRLRRTRRCLPSRSGFPDPARLPPAGMELPGRSPFPHGRSRPSWNGSARRGECGLSASNRSFAIPTPTTIRWQGYRPFARLRLQGARQPHRICVGRWGWSGQGVPAGFRRAATVAAVTRCPVPTGE